MIAIFDSATCSQLVLTLGHFIWQGLAVGGVVWLAGVVLRRGSSSLRYRVYLSALVVMSACPVVTFHWLTRDTTRWAAVEPSSIEAHEAGFAAEPETADTVSPESAVAVAPNGRDISSVGGAPTAAIDLSGVAEESPANAQETDWRRFAPWLSAVYFAGVLGMWLRLVLGLRGGGQLRRASEPVVDPELLDLLTQRARSLGLRAVPPLAWCRSIAVPTVVGVIRPAILLPIALTTGLTPNQISAILTHELAHIRRWDPLVNVFQRVVEAMLFFHPMVWLVSRRIRLERENCCDDMVLATGTDPLGYATSLLDIAQRAAGERQRAISALVALRADGRPSELGGRVRRMLGAEHHQAIRLHHRGLMLTALVGLIALAGLAVTAAQAPSPEAKQAPAKATLPNGIVVELVGVGFHPSKDRKWWKPDGTKLETRPYEESGGKVMVGSPEQAREFRIEIHGLPREHAVTTDYGSVATATGSVFSEGLWVGDHAAGPFESPTTSIRVGLTVEPFGPPQSIDAQGRKQEPVDAAADLERLYEQVVPLRVEESEGRTELIFDASKIHSLRQQADLRIHAIDLDGHAQRSTFGKVPRSNELHLGFPLPLSRVARFEYRLRPYRYWVTFDNVSLQPGRLTDVEIEIEAPEKISLKEFAELATRVTLQMPFASHEHRQQTAGEFRELVRKYGPEQPSTEFVRSVLEALDRHRRRDFPEGPNVKDPMRRDQYYIERPAILRMLQWRLFMALERGPLNDEQQARLADQHEWMRAHIRSLPSPPAPFEQSGHSHQSVLAALQAKIDDPLSPMFQEPLSDEQFAVFQQKLWESHERLGDRALLFVLPRIVDASMQVRYDRAAEIPAPELDSFDEQPISYGQTNGRLRVAFPSSEAFRGMQNVISDYRESGNFISLSDSRPSLLSFGGAGGPGQDGTLGEIDRWLAEKENRALGDRAHLIFDAQEMRIIGVRGTRLVPLDQQRFSKVDGVSAEMLIARVEEEGDRDWKLPEPTSSDQATGESRYGELAAVRTPDDRLFILRVQQHGPAGLQFHVRRHHPASDREP